MAKEIGNRVSANRLTEIRDALRKVTEDCREDMHEPNNQGVRATVVGSCLNNAMGAEINMAALLGGYQELVVVLEHNSLTYNFNLVDLIALARMAK